MHWNRWNHLRSSAPTPASALYIFLHSCPMCSYSGAVYSIATAFSPHSFRSPIGARTTTAYCFNVLVIRRIAKCAAAAVLPALCSSSSFPSAFLSFAVSLRPRLRHPPAPSATAGCYTILSPSLNPRNQRRAWNIRRDASPAHGDEICLRIRRAYIYTRKDRRRWEGARKARG